MSIAPITSTVSSLGPIINPEAGLGTKQIPSTPATGNGASFANMLRDAISTDAKAEQSVQSYAVGETQNLHETMIALQKADITISLITTVRNKLLDAYREVMRMS